MTGGNNIKKKRHMRILELIGLHDVETQEDLMNLLKASGFEVTQATVSRDIRDLQLTKSISETGAYRYTSAKKETEYSENKYKNILYESVISCDTAMNLVIIRAFSGMAPAAGAAIDFLGWDEVVGSIAGDDTVFLATKDAERAETVKAKLNLILNSK